MDKLKYIKIENEDGTLSDNVPIGADAENIDVSNNKSLDIKLSEIDNAVNAAQTTANNATNSISTEIAHRVFDVSNLQSQISSLASGGPAGVYATVAALTSADPDHSKIYIVTADGHWYYYNNGWQDGGLYQAAEDSENIANIQTELKLDSENLYHFDEHCIQGYYVDNRGYIAQSPNASMMKLPVTVGKTYYFLSPNWITNKYKTIPSFAIAFLDIEGNIVYFENTIEIINKNVNTEHIDVLEDFFTIHIPTGITHIATNLKINAFDIEHAAVVVDSETFGMYKDFDTDLILRNLIDLSLYPNLFTNQTLIYNKYLSTDSNTPKTLTNAAYAKIPVKANTDYYFYRPEEVSVVEKDAMFFWDAEENVLKNNDLKNIKFEYAKNGNIKIYYLHTPDNCAYVGINTTLILYASSRTTVFREYVADSIITAQDKEARKKLDFILSEKNIKQYPNFETATTIYNEYEDIDLIGENWILNQFWSQNNQRGYATEYADTDYCVLSVNPGETYFLKGKSQASARLFNLVKGDNFNLKGEYPTVSDNTMYGEYLVTIPDGVTKMCVNRWHDSSGGYHKQCQLEIYKINDFIVYPKKIYENLDRKSSVILRIYPQEEYPQSGRHLSAIYTKAVRHAAIVEELNAEIGDILEFQYKIATARPDLIDGWITNWSRTPSDASRCTYLNTTTDYSESHYSVLAGLLYNGDAKNEFIYNGWSGGGYIGFSHKKDVPFNNIKDIPVYILDIKIVNKTKNTSYVFAADDWQNNVRNTAYTGTRISPSGIEGYETTNQFLDIPPYVTQHDALGFSKWYAIGDSITEKNFRAKTNYFDYCVNDLNIEGVNLGKSGTGYKKTNNTFITRIDQITSYNYDTDIITVYGSINDNSLVAEHLGQLGDTTTDTLYGSMYTFFNTLFTKFGAVRVGLITPIPWKNSKNSASAASYKQALIETANLFNVPYLDLEKCTNLRPDDPDFLEVYYLSDNDSGSSHQVDTGGVHPNSIGHKLFYNRIKEFLKTL